MHELLQKRTKVSSAVTPAGVNGPVVFTSTGDKFIVTPSNPISPLRYGIIWTTAKDASAFSMTAALRPTAGSDTSRVVVDTMSDALGRAVGTLSERKPVGANPNSSTGSDGSLVNVASGSLGRVNPGQELVFAVTVAATSTGGGYIYVEYVEHAAVAEYLYNSTTLAYTVVQL